MVYIIAPELSSFLLIQKAGKYQLLEFEIQKYEKIREIFSEKWKNPNRIHADLQESHADVHREPEFVKTREAVRVNSHTTVVYSGRRFSRLIFPIKAALSVA